ncbi:MAG: M1 family aminopeptidase, partial [Bacteroidota bacterium]
VIPGFIFRMFIILLTFIYTGLLMHRPEKVAIYQLEDASPVPTWTFLLSRLSTVVIMQIALLLIIMLTGIGIQIYNGFYDFELGLYLKDLLGVRLIGYTIWALFAVFVHALVPNFYAGLFTLLVVSLGMNFLDRIGIEQDIFKYNNGPGTFYSDMSGYGTSVVRYFVYKGYWLLLGIVFLISAGLIQRRGVRRGFISQLRAIPSRTNRWTGLSIGLFLVAFITVGRWIYTETNVRQEYVSSKLSEQRTAEYEITYKRFDHRPQPKITAISLDIDLRPETRDLRAIGTNTLVNKTNSPIDSIFINDNSLTKEISFDRANDLIIDDTVQHIQIYALAEPLAPGDTMTMDFVTYNEPNRLLYSESPVRENGTFFNSSIFPRIGYDSGLEHTDDKRRRRYGLEPKERMMDPTDSLARMNNYISLNSDWIDFEAVVSTAPDQIAMVPGKLIREWEEDGRRHFQYRMQSKMLNFYNIISARYEEYSDEWNGVPITIYYHKGHDYNLERIMKGAKGGLAYCSEAFSPYQHGQLRILEFPSVTGGFAQSFANTIPFSESIGFIADVDEDGGIDYPFSVSAHEVAHQWWAHQVIGANAKGATMLSESPSEYVSLQVLKREHGEGQMRTFLKEALDKYLLGRTVERKKEQPLMLNENQQHIHYQKGSMVFYALSDYLGEEAFNDILSEYVDSVCAADFH